MDTDDALTALTALGHPSRLAAFRALVEVGPAGLPVGTLRDRLDLPAATLSAHLNVLRAAGLVLDRREGRVINVSAGYARMDALVAFLMQNCCAGEAACAPAESACPPGGSCGPASVSTAKPTTTKTRTKK